MSARSTLPLLFVVACGSSPAPAVTDQGASTPDATAPDAAPATSEASAPPSDAGCEITMGAPILASVPDGTSWETSIDAHHGVAVAAWISQEANTLVIRGATSKNGGPFGTPYLVPLEKSWGDPTVRYAPDGTLYIGSICNVTPPVLPGNDICVVMSKDDGATFSPSIRVTPPAHDPTNLRDRPWIAVAPDGRVAVSYLDGFIDDKFAVVGGGRLMYVVGTRSGDTLTFGAPKEVSPGHMPDSGLYNGTYSMPLAFDRTGRFHGAFEIGDFGAQWFALRYTRSSEPDLEETEPAREIVNGGYPVAATAGASSVAVLTFGPGGVVFLRSTDGGDHFEPPRVLGDAKREAYLPWLAGDASGGFHAAWLDRLNETAPWIVHYQHLPADGRPTKPSDVATGFFTPDEASWRKLGDFIGITVDDDGMPKMAWSEPQPTGGAVVRAAFGTCR
jgi:hypothetical protein